MRSTRPYATIFGCLIVLGLGPAAFAQPRVSDGDRSPAARPVARPATATPKTTGSPAPKATRARAARSATRPAAKTALTMRPAVAQKKNYGPGAITLNQAVAMAKRQNLDLKVSKISIRSCHPELIEGRMR